MIPDDLIERIRESADIVQIIGEHVTLRRTGTDFRGPCPFHQGTHRNFSVSPRKKIYYCFVCHEGGDVFSFLQKRLGLDWPAAVRLVAEKSGIEVREVETRREGPDPRDPIWELNAAAAEFFARMLWEDELGAPAREYLESRRVGREMATRFGLGFAPREIGLMRSHLATLGYDDERQLVAGLLVRPEEASEPRPRFRGRLIFPILDALGRHVGFGGRVIGQGEPKYLNSPESPVYSKGKLLYGLNWARNSIRREDRALVVEGYFDVVRLVAAGLESVVAPLGTALTADQAALLARYTKNIFLLYDSDRAGQRATFKAADELLKHRVSVQVVTLPPGEDPDTLVDTRGITALETQLTQAIDVFERKVQLLDRAGWFTDLRRKRQAIDHLLPTIRAAADPLMQELYLTRASEASGVAKDVLARELGLAAERKAAAGRGSSAGASAGSPRAAAGGAPRRQPGHERTPPPERRGGADRDRRIGDRRTPRRPREHGSERELVSAMLHQRSLVELVSERIGTEAFRDPRYRDIFGALLRLGADAPVEALAEVLDPDALDAMQVLLGEANAHVDREKTVSEAMAKIRVRELERELRQLDEDLRYATPPEQEQIVVRKRKLQEEIVALGSAHARWKMLSNRK